MHKDGDKSNCRLNNLCWRTRSYTHRYAQDWGTSYTPSGHAVKAVDGTYTLLGVYESEGDLAQAYGVLVDDVFRAASIGTALPFNPGVYVTYESVR